MIRPASTDDHDAIVGLAVVSGLFDADQTELLSEMLRSPDESHVWLADCVETQLVSVAFLAPEKMTSGTWNLYWITVHPHFQKTGRGTAMLKHIESMLLDRGVRILLVETAGTGDFEYVRDFYRRNGFENEGRIRDFYDTGIDKIIFRKKLTA